ncbi:isoprenyl transferase [Frischella sp. Ac48]|uniref:Ditrans,polycis-undecaprenyl-diphosphate synthase ((2E,6E)-farnesyl-diphosphate specific) n=1 Tax=Frischella japonica TaxID=2741544 RepID=A0ABR7QZV3_9GAMM|nr:MULTISPECIES: isoprenyl transferase [Frischella]MBC9131610.1 isoprenyl transferase [Frischella japonica]MBX4134056.1 isoprenyl transferase [Frischella sp. Ac48]
MIQQTLIPKHIGIIMDGNGRWAKNRNLLRIVGHRAGLRAVRRTVERANELGVKVLTLYAFSSENWNRPEQEVSALMALFIYALNKEVKILHRNNIQLNIIGDITRFPAQIQKMIKLAQAKTKNNTGLILNIAANYGGRWDIVNSVKKLINQYERQSITLDMIDEEAINKEIALYGLPAVDLVIRTGGEYRISNFLLWQIAYSELYFTDVLWPDFNKETLDDAISEFIKRERRFGQISGA